LENPNTPLPERRPITTGQANKRDRKVIKEKGRKER
jgi:hypothetical protein